MQQLLNKLLSGDGKLSLLLLEAREFAVKANDNHFLKFVDNELNGYSDNADLPSYRKIRSDIVVTIKDNYGNTIQKEQPLDFSKLSEKIGSDLSIAFIPEGIGFIEASLDGLSSNIAIKPFLQPMVRIINDIFKPTNPSLNLTEAGHRFGKAALQYILVQVRQDLTVRLQQINRDSYKELNELLYEKERNSVINVFVTYSWENDDHNDLIISFVDFLRQKGYNATMDRKESQERSSINFNRMMIEGIQNSNKVIIVLSPSYKSKADSFMGGVGTEFSIIIEEIKNNENKFIFVSFGNNNLAEITPMGIKGREILNLKEDQNNDFNYLFSKLQSKNIIKFSEVNDSIPEVKQREIKPFKL